MHQKQKLIPLLFLLFFGVKNSVAQDFHFSQFDLAPLYVSPALTGFMSAQNRIAIKYRSQWSSVLQENEFETILVSYDGRLCPREGISFAYGVNIVKDQVGFPAFKTNQYMGSFAFHIKLNSGHFASAGFQTGLLQYRWDASQLKFDSQFDGTIGFDLSLPSMESFLDREKINLIDLSGGILLYSRNKIPWNFGVAFHHVNPKNYYAFTSTGIQDNNRTKVRWVIHGAIPFAAGKHFLAFKGMSIVQLPHWQLNTGVDFRFQFSKNKTNPIFNFAILGVGLRLSNRPDQFLVTDAAIISLKTDIAIGLLFGMSYDVNISPLKKFSRGRGGAEVSLIWEFPIREKTKCVTCPDMNSSTFGQGMWQ